MLPTDSDERKGMPIYTGFVKYFPHAIAACAQLSRICNEKHNPGEPVHWSKGQSQDELDALMRHTVDFAIDPNHRNEDGTHPAVSRMWRACADVERLHDAGVNIFAIVPPATIEAAIQAKFDATIGATIDEAHTPTQEEIRDIERMSSLPTIPTYQSDHLGPWDVVFTDDHGCGLEGETRRGPYATVEEAQSYAERNPERLSGLKSIQPSNHKVRENHA